MRSTNQPRSRTLKSTDTKICGTEALQQLVKNFEERRKVDAEINTSSWRLGDDKHVDSHYLGSPDLHDRLEKHRQDTKATGEIEGYNVHFHPELHASWTYGIYGVGSKVLCEMHNDRQTRQLKSGDVRYNRQLWRQGDKNSRISVKIMKANSRVAILRAVIASLKENGYSKTVKLVDSLFKNFFFQGFSNTF